MSMYDQQPPKSMGPHGLGRSIQRVLSYRLNHGIPELTSSGDPDDMSLRKVEAEILVPKIMRDRAKKEKCIPEVQLFETCCKDNGIKMIYSCRSQNDGLKACLTKWYQDEEFKAECRNVYLTQRAEYRRTGIKKADEKK